LSSHDLHHAATPVAWEGRNPLRANLENCQSLSCIIMQRNPRRNPAPGAHPLPSLLGSVSPCGGAGYPRPSIHGIAPPSTNRYEPRRFTRNGGLGPGSSGAAPTEWRSHMPHLCLVGVSEGSWQRTVLDTLRSTVKHYVHEDLGHDVPSSGPRLRREMCAERAVEKSTPSGHEQLSGATASSVPVRS